MNISGPFINRPIATSLLMLAVFILGLLSYKLLPIASLPEVDYPSIQVITKFPGADPHVISSSITAPLERQFGQMSGLNQMTSSSSNGYSNISLQFTLDSKIEIAEQEVQAAINAASGYLPKDLPSPPIYNKVNPSDTPIITLALTSSLLPLPKIQDFAETRLAQKISQISGVGLVSIVGGQRPAIRIKANATLLASYNMTLDSIRSAINNANVNGAKGNFDGLEISYSINANDQLTTGEEYKSLIIAYKDSRAIRLSDVAQVSDDVEDSNQAAWVNKTQAIIINIQRQPGANVIKVADTIKSMLPKLAASLPSSIKLSILSDRTQTIRSSVKDVTHELLLAILLVILVIFIFLGSFSLTIIPSIAVPLSLIGSFSIMYLLDYSLNNLTLMALTIATGFVVDDAIVMIENIARYIEQGMKPIDAAFKGAKEIGFTIISLTISLIAVLIPLFFMQDMIGKLFREFAITLTIAITLSALVSLTLIPMLSAKILKPHSEITPNKFAVKAEEIINKIIDYYGKTLLIILQHRKSTLIFAIVTFIFTLLLFFMIPKGFFPNQDTGAIYAISQMEQNISFNKMADKQQELADIILKDAAVENLSSFIGIDSSNLSINIGRMLITLKDKRKANADEIIARIMPQIRHIKEAEFYMHPVQDISVATKISNGLYQYSLIGQDKEELHYWSNQLTKKLSNIPILRNVNNDQQENALQVFITINRDKASTLGITASMIDNALYNMFGQRQISTIFTQRNQYQVVLEALPHLQKGLQALDNIYLKTLSGNVVPLKSFANVEIRNTPLVINRYNQFSNVTISFDIKHSADLEAAINAVENAKEKLNIPPQIQGDFNATAKTFKNSLSNEGWLVLAAILVVYIVLGVLYESYIHPITILSTLPSACMGALIALWITGSGLDVIGIIGIILLIGIVKKNAIMMIDFALQEQRHNNKSAEEAIFQACLLRFRPILMTSLAAIFGAIPLVMSLGIGAELRKPLGISIIAGLVVSQILTLYTTPVIYLAFDKIANKNS
jgi:multidrug efflux pump